MIFTNQLRRHMANSDVFIADRRLYTDMDAKIVECNAAGALKKIWPLCCQALSLDNGKLLILTEASEDTWQASLDKFLTEDLENAIARIRWKPSRNGGRPWLTPRLLPCRSLSPQEAHPEREVVGPVLHQGPHQPAVGP